MAVLDKEPLQIETNQRNSQAATLNDSDKPCVKTKQEVGQFTEPAIKERSSNLKEQEQVKAIYHYLLIVADKNYSINDRVAAAKHLATYYFKRPIYHTDWYINKARINRELNYTGTDIIGRTKTCLFESVDVMEKGQTKKEAVKAVINKLSIVMLIDLLGEGWRNKPRRSEITGLGIGEGRELSTIDFILNETYGDNDPSLFSPRPTENAIFATEQTASGTDGATGVRLNSTPCRNTFELDEQYSEMKDISSVTEGVVRSIGEDEVLEEVLGLKKDKDIVEWRKASVEYHRGIVGINGRPSKEWADLISLGVQRKELTELDPGILLKQVIDKANLSEFQKDVILAVSAGMSQTEYAKLHGIEPTRVRKAKQRAIEKMKKVAARLEKKVK